MEWLPEAHRLHPPHRFLDSACGFARNDTSGVTNPRGNGGFRPRRCPCPGRWLLTLPLSLYLSLALRHLSPPPRNHHPNTTRRHLDFRMALGRSTSSFLARGASRPTE